MALRYTRPGGVGQYFGPDGMSETNTKKCQHCGTLVDIPTMRDFHKYMDMCRQCWQPMCLNPACLAAGCVPLMKKIEQAEQDYYRQQQNRKIMGL